MRGLSLIVCAVGLSSALASSSARAALDVKFDCYLASGNTSCRDLESALFSNKAYAHAPIDAAGNAVADVDVSIRAIGVANATRYHVELHGKQLAFQFDDAIPVELSRDAVLLRLVGDIEKLTAPLFINEEPPSFDDGVLHFTLSDPKLGPRKARSDDESTGWYVAPSLSLNTDRYGVLELSTHANLEVNWSNPRWRLHGWSWSDYRYVHIDDASFAPKDRTYQNLDGGSSWVAAHSFFASVPGFTVTAQAEAESSPQENYLLRANTYAGVEWVLVPFLKTDEGNVGIQYVVGAEHMDFLYVSVLDTKHLDWLRHRCSVFGAWHFSTVDLDSRFTVESMVNDLHFSAFSGYAQVTWHVLDDLSLNVGGDASFRNGLVNEPKNLDDVPPLAAFYGGGAFGDVTFDGWLSVTYVFGNSLLLRQDQRWK